MTEAERTQGQDGSIATRVNHKELLDQLREGIVSPREVLWMKTNGAGKIRLRDLCEQGYGMSQANTGQLLLMMGIHDWANYRVEMCSDLTLTRFDKAFEIYETEYMACSQQGEAGRPTLSDDRELAYAR